MPVMRVDVVPYKYFIVVGVVSTAVFITSLIIGAVAPKSSGSISSYAYNCPDSSHVWNSNCKGVQLNDNSTTWSLFLPEVGLTNRYMYVDLIPYRNQPYYETDINGIKLQIEVTLTGSTEATVENQEMIANNTNTTYTIKCKTYSADSASPSCDPLLIVLEDELKYDYYMIHISFPDSDNAYWIGDVELKSTFGNALFVNVEVGLRTAMLVLISGVLVFYIHRMQKTHKLEEWKWEQKALLGLLIGALLYDNPFFGLIFAVKGWFFPFLDAFFHAIFFCILLVYWSLHADRIRLEESSMKAAYFNVPKMLIITVFGVFEIALFSWQTMEDMSNPIYGSKPNGATVLYWIVSFMWTFILIAIGILGTLAFPFVLKRPFALTRYIFATVPALIMMICVMAGVLAGVWGPIGKSGMSYSFYTFTFNLYVLVLAWGYWPVEINFVGNPTESSETSRLTFS